MRITCFKDIEEKKLIQSWNSLQMNNVVFPMMRFEWIKTWWKANSKGLELRIFVVFNQDDQPLALAPFCLIQKGSLRVLHTIPIHFGDFYHIIGADDAIMFLIQYLSKNDTYKFIHLFNVNSESSTYGFLEKNLFHSRRIVRIYSCDFSNLDFDKYLSTLSSNARQQYRKKIKRISQKGNLVLQEISNMKEYLKNFESLRSLYETRWENDDRELLSDEYYVMRNSALNEMFNQNRARLFLIKLNEEIIAYRLGFISNNVFYDWKAAHNPLYNYYSPGMLSVGLIIEFLISKGYTTFNFMAGDYRYKKTWSTEDKDSFNYEFFRAKGIQANIYLNYRLKWREEIKSLIKKIKLLQ